MADLNVELRRFTVGSEATRPLSTAESAYRGPQLIGVRRAGRFLNTASYAKSFITDEGRWFNPRTMPVVNTTPTPIELRHWAFTSDRQPPLADVSLLFPRKVDEIAGPNLLPIQLRRFVVGPDPLNPHPTDDTWYRGIQRQGVRRAGRFFTSQPWQPSIVPESSVTPFRFWLVPMGALPENLRRFVTGDPAQRPFSDDSVVRTRKVDELLPVQERLELRRIVAGSDPQGQWGEASWWVRRQFESNADLYGVRRPFFTHAPYKARQSTDDLTWRRQIPPLFESPVELRRFVTGAERLAAQWPESLWWGRQITIPLPEPGELRKFVMTPDRQPPLPAFSLWLMGPQIPPLGPGMPMELRHFVVPSETTSGKPSDDILVFRRPPFVIVFPVELERFVTTSDRQPVIVPESRFMPIKVPEKPIIPLELQHFITTPVVPAQWGYIIERGYFWSFVVPDVTRVFKYHLGYTIITKKTRLS